MLIGSQKYVWTKNVQVTSEIEILSATYVKDNEQLYVLLGTIKKKHTRCPKKSFSL